MSEKEKMINGEFYRPLEDEKLIQDRKKVKDLCFEYNLLPPSKEKERT